jgi:hypothetical protein
MLVQRMTESQLNDLSLELVRGRVFLCVSWDDEAMRNAFGLVSALLVEAVVNEMGTTRAVQAFNAVGACWERFERASPRSIDGFPLFMSINLLHINDLPRLHDKVEELNTALKTVHEKCENCGVSVVRYRHSFESLGVCVLLARDPEQDQRRPSSLP